MSKRSYLRKSAVSLAATLGLGGLGTVANAQLTLPPNLTIGSRTIEATNALRGAYYDTAANPPEASFTSVAGIRALEASSILAGAPVIEADLNVNLDFDQGNTAPPFFPHGNNDSLFSVWSGELIVDPAAAGTYTFSTASDDGSVIHLDGQYVVQNNFYQGRTRRDYTYTLTPGVHPIVIGWYEGGSGANMTAYMSGGPNNAAEKILNPATPLPGLTFRKVSFTTDTSKNGQSVNVTADGKIDIQQEATVAFGALTVANGTTLTMDMLNNGLVNASFTEANLGATATFGINGGQVNVGPLKSAGAVTTITKTGAGTMRVATGAGSTMTGNPAVNVNGGTLAIGISANSTSVGTGAISLSGGTLSIAKDPGVPSQAGIFGTTGQFYHDDDVFAQFIMMDSTNTFGWSALDSKPQLDAKFNALTPDYTVPVNIELNFPRADNNPANGGTNDEPNDIFNTGGANLGVPLTGSDAGGITSDFAARFTGKLNVTTAGAYGFTVASNDGGVMFVDTDLGPGQTWVKVADNNRFSTSGGGAFQERGTGSTTNLLDPANPGPTINQAPATTLAVGQYDYVVGTFNKNTDEYGLEVFWTPPGGTKELLPSATAGPATLTNALTVSGNSGLNIQSVSGTLSNLTMNPGSRLAVTGNQLTTAIKASDAGTVSIGATSGPDVRITTLDDGGKAVVFAAGPGRARLTVEGGPGLGAGSSVGATAGGTLVITNTATGNTLGTTPVTLSGGTLELNVAPIDGPGFVAGLREGRVAGAFNITAPNPANRGIVLEPIRAQVPGSGNVEPFPDNTTYIYTGQMFFPDNGGGQSKFAMAECFDDSTQIKIDGVERLNNGAWNVANTTGELTVPAGWHDVEFRFGEGGGGWGPSGQDGWVQNPAPGIAPGFGVDFTLPIDASAPPIQSEFARPVDDGTMKIFRTAPFVSPTFQSNVTATDNSKINVTGANSATIGNLSVADGKTLSVLGNGLTAGNITTGAGGMLTFSGGASKITGSLNGAGTVQATKSFALEFTGSGAASTGSSKLDIATLANMKFSPGAGNTFQGATLTAISNEGLLHAANGTVDLSGSTMTTTNVAGFVPGLLEGRLSGAFNVTDPNPGTSPNPTVGGVKLEPRLAQIAGNGNVEPWPDNTTHVYTGQILIPDNDVAGDGMGTFAIAEHFDDNTLIKIDGVERINNTQWDVPNTTGVLTLPAGWHDIEMRFGEGGGGWGPSNSMNWTDTLGVGIDFTVPIDPSDPPLQSEFVRPVDDGKMSLFRYFNPPVENVRVDAGATLKLGAIVGGNIVNVNGRLELHGATSKLLASGMKIAGTPTAPTGTLDVTDSAIVLDYADGDPSPAADVRSRIIAGRGAPGLIGTWDGKGITSSTSAAAPDSTSVGYAVNGDMPLGAVTEFRGVPVDPTSVLIRHTRIGDANLDGVVNDDDVTIVGAVYAPGVPNANWANGDFDYNGFVDDDDVTLLGALYNPGLPPIPAPEAGAGVAAVPEPSTWLMLTLGGLGAGLFGWRRRKK